MESIQKSAFAKIIIILILLILIIGGAVGYYLSGTAKKIEKNKETNITATKTSQFLLSAGVVPHHLLAKNLIEGFFSYIASQGNPETIVLLSPDHFQTGNISGKRLITINPQREKFYNLEIDDLLIKDLKKENDLVFADSTVSLDHGITNLLDFIKKYFPKSKIVPFVIPTGISSEQSEQFAVSLDSLSSPKTIVIASVDFSHYLPVSAAKFHDVMSIRTLINFEKENFENLEVDSWQALYIARAFARLKGKESPEIIGYSNSNDFLKNKILEETTSHFSLAFKKEPQKSEETVSLREMTRRVKKFNGKTILFVGDIMLDRKVEHLMQKNSVFYPFQRISQFLRGVDITFGNLEGPIVKKPKDFPDDSLMFAFSPDVTRGLAFAKFNLLTLANNHTLNMGEIGLEETREILSEANINSVGDPVKCGEECLFQKDNIIFLAFNKTFSFNCSDEKIVRFVKEIRDANPEKFLIVVFHWGNEYKTKSSISQQKLAHRIIDAGASTILGFHPHVVQGIEKYKGKLIFYSLGNFIFDQYFSTETQQGLAIGLEVYPEELIYRLFPIQSHLSQPFLMEQGQAKKFLANLAQRSNQELIDQIENGIIEITRNNNLKN